MLSWRWGIYERLTFRVFHFQVISWRFEKKQKNLREMEVSIAVQISSPVSGLWVSIVSVFVSGTLFNKSPIKFTKLKTVMYVCETKNYNTYIYIYMYEKQPEL